MAVFACASAGAVERDRTAPADVGFSVRGEAVVIDVLANDAPVGDRLRIGRVRDGAHGTAVVADGRIVYTPDAGFAGSDRFTYVVHPKGGAPHTGVVDVHVSRTGARVRIDGRVVGGPLSGEVSTVIAGHRFASRIQDDRRYSIDLHALDGAALVRLEAQGATVAGVETRYFADLGPAADLERLAGVDGVLDDAETRRVRISALGTAHHLLAASALGGAIDNARALRQASEHVDPEQLLRGAALVHLLAEGVPLPAGATPSTLLGDAAVREAFIASLPAGRLDAAIATQHDVAREVAGFGTSGGATGYALTYASAPGTVRVGRLGQALIEFGGRTAADAGTGRYIAETFRSGDVANWVRVDGRISVMLDEPVVSYSFPFNACARQDREVLSLRSLDLARLHDGDGVDVVEVTYLYDRVTEDLMPGDACVPREAGQVMAARRFVAFESGAGERPFTDSAGTGERLVPDVSARYSPDGLPAWGARIADLSAPEARTEVIGGRLRFQDPSGDTFYEVRRLTEDGQGADGVMAVAYRRDGTRSVKADMSVVRDAAFAFRAEAMAGTYESGFNLSDSFPIGATVLFARIRDTGSPMPQGDYLQVSTPDDGSLVESVTAPFSWMVDSLGRWQADSYRQFAFPSALPYCQIGVRGCYVSQRRSWMPLASSGGRVYVLESLEQFTASGARNVVSVRANFYDAQP
ncbi:Ig-like domain-containing protein [Lysobacter humi (ex Lee et al. 2017)]